MDKGPNTAGGRKLSWSPSDLRILVVDDEPTTRLAIQRGLQSAGYTSVTLADSGKTALSLLREYDFQLVLLDISMPEMDGHLVLNQIMSDPKLKNSLVIMMSSTEDLPTTFNCLQAGAVHFLVKPIHATLFKGLWQTVWRWRKEQKMQQEFQRKLGEQTRKTEQLKEEIKTLKSTPVETVSQAPIVSITNGLNSVLNRDDINDEVKSIISGVLASVKHSTNLYQPTMESTTLPQSVDAETREWLMTSLSSGVTSSSTSPSLSSTTSSANTNTGGNQSASSQHYSGNAPIRIYESGDITTSEEEENIEEKEESTTENTKSDIKSWGLNVWSIENDWIVPLIVKIFDDMKMLDIYKINRNEFQFKFLKDIQSKYRNTNPYHNFRHCFDVVQGVFLLLKEAKASQYLKNLEIFALLIAALIHDIDHDGFNNTYHIATQSDLALEYNDRSVLENHHCSTGFKIMKKYPQFWSTIPIEEKQTFRKLIIDAVLGTDLGGHFELINRFKAISSKFNKDDDSHRALLMIILLKCADLSNPSRPFETAKYWGSVVQEEFFRQGENEKAKGLHVSPFMDRENSSLPQMQINFIEYLVIPLFTDLHGLLGGNFDVPFKTLLDNKSRWAQFLEEEKKEKRAAQVFANSR